MDAKLIMFAVVIAISAVLIVLQLWLRLLGPAAAQPLWILIGLMGVVGGFLNIRRIRAEQ